MFRCFENTWKTPNYTVLTVFFSFQRACGKIEKMATTLSVVHFILIIGFGGVAFLILFIFAKRQIMRFALKSRRGPHVSVGHHAPKALKKEIERRMDRIQEIKHEPHMLRANDYRYRFLQGENPTGETITYIYRMKAVDAVSLLDEQLEELDLRRQPGYSVREHLLDLREGIVAPLKLAKPSLLRAFADSYEHARHGFKPFGESEYIRYMGLLNEILLCIRKHIESQGETGTVKRRKTDSGVNIGDSSSIMERTYVSISGSSTKDKKEFIKMGVINNESCA
ncbi:protein C1orf43 homolog isoform X2 [Saccoglossus kowalevskii]